MIRFSSCNTSEEKEVQSTKGTHETRRQQEQAEKVKRAHGEFFYRLNLDECFLFCIMSSGSVSSFNDEDYEVDENSDEEEQEEPGDYCKGTLAIVATIG